MTPANLAKLQRLRARVEDRLMCGPPIVINEDGTWYTFWEAQTSQIRMLASIDAQLADAGAGAEPR
jgi:hypothetical protein